MKQILTIAFLVYCMYTNAQSTTITRKGITIELSRDTIWIVDNTDNIVVDFDYLKSTDRPRKHGLYPGQKALIVPAKPGKKILVVRFDNERYRFKLWMRGSGAEEDFLDVIAFRSKSCDCGRH